MVRNEVAKETPILFSGPMISAILEGRKTMTRRINTHPRLGGPNDVVDIDDIEAALDDCPYGEPGDQLWVRETFQVIDLGEYMLAAYKASCNDGYFDFTNPNTSEISRIKIEKWRPSIFMPRWASRIKLEITDLRIEQLQDISEEDAKAEGLYKCTQDHGTYYGIQWADVWETDPRRTFKRLWDSINSKRGFGWDKNPWVTVVSFKRI